jgi:ubiquinone/menaquinone biosynthesis C-methylase UbiE
MHFGFWSPGVIRFRDALQEQNAELARLSNIKPQQKILDAGCGVGGTSFYLANHFEAFVTGISILQSQISQCSLSQKTILKTGRCSFEVADYHKLPFADETFDSVWFIESLCHSPHKDIALKEAIRVLKKGGILIVSDGFESTGQKSKSYQNWIQSWAIPDLPSETFLTSILKNLSVSEVNILDYTPAILPSSQRMYRLAIAAKTIQYIRAAIGNKYGTDETRKLTAGAGWQYRALKAGDWRYKVLIARK